MKHYEVRRTLAASPADIWSVIASGDTLQNGNFGINRFEGTIGPGAKIKLWSEVSPERAFTMKVQEFTPNRRMVWKGGMPLGLFTGIRQFNLSETTGGTEFHMREEFSGLLLGLIWKTMPDLGPSFEKFADGLQTTLEGSAA